MRSLMKHFIQRGLGQVGLEIRRIGSGRDVIDFLTDRNIDVVLDVGGNVGQFGLSLRAEGYRGKIVSFEPIPSVFQVLATTAAADGNWETNNFGLGVEAGQATINVSNASVFSSILTSRPTATHHEATAIVTHAEKIEVRTLDDALAGMTGNMLLKIDTQGYEKQVLAGGRRALTRMKGVLMELSIIHLYTQTWHFHEAIAFMAEAGFVPAQFHPVSYHSADKVSLVEVDCLFRPHDERID